ncbi:MAG TPA: hypothetical protein VNC22_22780 [Sporichthya sp.]|nr:hypothetical protein [Sporichthya sp.]
MTTSDLAHSARGRFSPHYSLTGRNRAGLITTFVLGVINIPSIGMPSGDDGSDGGDGPPFGVLVLDSICGVVMVVACFIAWRQGKRAAVRIAAGVSILQALSAVPAFFVDVDAWVKVLVGVVVVVTFVGVVLMLSPERRSPAVLD